MPLTSDEVASRFPIHWLVWNNKHEELKEALESNKFSREDIEKHDNRGRTPLLLAVTLGHIESVQVLIDANADVNCEKDGWTAVQEATATGNPALLSLVLSRRDYQRYVVQSSGIPELLNKLSLAPDFYVEMKWEFTSWVPLVSRMCPFDTYKVYKRGANVRVDTTLVGFENNRWQRGDRTYIFRGQGSSASLVELDHEAGTSGCEYFEVGGERGARGWPPPPPHVIEQRLAAPLAINYLDTDKISFERNKSGIWGWRQDKSESVNGYECKVFSANNVELVSKTRSEHLPRGERRAHTPRAPLAGLLALADGDDSAPAAPASPLLTPDRVSEDTSESVNGYECKVFSANNVELVSKTRSEHLPRGERRAHTPRAPLAGLLALADGDDSAPAAPASPLLTPDRVSEDTSESVNGYECKVFSANNVELVSKTRSEHLPRGERRAHTPRAPLAGLLALADGDDSAPAAPASPLLTPDRVSEDTSESVNGYECKVFSANNVELVSKTRSEHLPRGERRAHTPRAPLAGLLALADGDDSAPAAPASPLLTPDRVSEDTSESVNGYECKVFSANNVELVSKTRSEHLPRGERRAHTPRAPLAGLLALADGDDSAPAAPASPLLTPDRVSEDTSESVNGYECKVFSANNVELVSKTRSEHLPRGERRAHTPRAPLAGLLALADGDDSAPPTPASPLLTPDREEPPKRSRSREDLRPAAPVTWEEYFADEPLDREIGRPRDIATKVQKFRATLWLCEDYPLELQEQIMPILDLMASISSPHFAKLKDFIQMQLPAGFPVKIEIPLFHVLNARITFGNIFATETPVTHVECIQEGERLSCVVDDQCFNVGRGYRDAAAPDERLSCDDDEGLLQYAIQQSLMEAGTHDDQVDVWEALRGARSTSPVPPRARPTPHLLLDNEDTHLQRAIEASLSNAPLDLRVPDADANVAPTLDDEIDELDADLRAALAISAREQAALDQQLQDEQKALDEALRLSLLDK